MSDLIVDFAAVAHILLDNFGIVLFFVLIGHYYSINLVSECIHLVYFQLFTIRSLNIGVFVFCAD